MEACVRCGSQDYFTEDGLYYCSICQTQSQTMREEIRDDDDGREMILTREIKDKSKKDKTKRKRKDTETGVPWCTLEAFNLILINQVECLINILKKFELDECQFKKCIFFIWSSYLRECELAFVDNEVKNGRKFHPTTCFRDIQVLKQKVQNVKKVKKTQTNDQSHNIVMDDILLREQSDEDNDEDDEDNEDVDSVNSDDDFNDDEDDNLFDYYFYGYDYKSKEKTPKKQINIETNRQLRKLISKLNLDNSFLDESLLDLEVDSDSESSEQIKKDEKIKTEKESETLDSQEKELNKSNIEKDNLDDRDNDDDDDATELSRLYDLIKDDLTKTAQVFLKYVPFDYFRNNHGVTRRDVFLNHMTLAKTIAILNLGFRIRQDDIFTFDIIRWINQGAIPYFDCLSCFPEEWKLFEEDLKMFTCPFSPLAKTINVLSAKIGSKINFVKYPYPRMDVLLERLVVDLNLPLEIVDLIEKKFNLKKAFTDILDQEKDNVYKSIPHYEVWALMSIVMLLKKIFVFDGKNEYIMSESNLDENLFKWTEWEQYTRTRLDLIKSYYPFIYGSNLEELKDVDVLTSFIKKRNDLRRSRHEKVVFHEKLPVRYQEYEFLSNLSQCFHQLSSGINEVEFPEPSLYPLTTATEFSLSRIRQNDEREELTKKLSVDFKNKVISPWICPHNCSFHRPYIPLRIGNSRNPSNLDKWSNSFKLLIEISSIILNCNQKEFYKILKEIEQKFYLHKANKKLDTRRNSSCYNFEDETEIDSEAEIGEEEEE